MQEPVVFDNTFSFWITLFPPAWQAAQLPAKTWAPFSKSAANAAGAMAIMPAKNAAATFQWKFQVSMLRLTEESSHQSCHQSSSNFQPNTPLPWSSCSFEPELSAPCGQVRRRRRRPAEIMDSFVSCSCRKARCFQFKWSNKESKLS